MTSQASAVQTSNSFQPRIFSGIQPSGGLTLGNYLGALKRFVEKQDEGIETIYCLVDLHAITVWQDPERLRQQTREGAAAFIAAGIDPKRSILFNQSQVSAHAELGWIFNCVARMGWMSRMTQWKDKTAGKNAEAMNSVMTKSARQAEDSGAKAATESFKGLTLHVLRSAKEENPDAPPLVWAYGGNRCGR